MTIRQARFSVGLASLLFSVTTTVASAQSATTAPSEVTGPVVASPVADSSGASTLDEQDVIRRLLQSESIQQQAQSRAAVADARGQSASLWDNPRIAYQRSQLEGGETEDQLQLSQSFDFSGRRGLWSDAASRRADAARARGTGSRWLQTTAARSVFFEALYRQERSDILQTWRARLAAALQTVELRVKSGDAPRYESLRLAQQSRRAEASWGAELAMLQGARSRLVALLTGDISLETKLAGELLPQRAPLTEAAMRGALSSRGDLLAQRHLADAAKLEQQASRRAWIPKLSLSVGYRGVETAGIRNNGYIAGASLALPVFNRAQGKSAEASARASEATATAKRRTQQAFADSRGLAVQVNQLREVSETQRKGSLPRLNELVTSVNAAYRGGEVGIVELIDAYRAEVNSRLSVVDLQWRARQAALKLDGLLGRTQS